jgi:ketosteroid isomerase-like protein
MKRIITALSLAWLLAGCGNRGGEEARPAEVGTVDTEALVADNPGLAVTEQWRFELLREDRSANFNLQTSGVRPWLSFFAPEGVLINPRWGEIRGRERIDTVFNRSLAAGATYSLAWEPEHAEVSNGGDLGYTAGDYRSLALDSAGTMATVTGKYVTIWRRQDDGAWKVERMMLYPLGKPGIDLDVP